MFIIVAKNIAVSMAPPSVLLVTGDDTDKEQLREALKRAATEATVRTATPDAVSAALLRNAVDCMVVPAICGDIAGGHLARAAFGLYPDLPVILYGTETTHDNSRAVANDDIDSPELAAAVGDALDGSETAAARTPSRPETILASMLDGFSQFLYAKNTDRQHVLANEASFAPTDLLGRREEDCLHAQREFLQAARGDDLQVIEDEDDVLDVHEFAPAMEEHMQTSKVPWYSADGDLLGLVGMTREITDQKERERLLSQQNERLRKVALLAAHELRNGLQVSTGHLSQVDSDDPHLEAAQESIDQLADVVDKVVSLASTESPTLQPRRLWLSTVVKDVWSSLSFPEATLNHTKDMRLLADPESIRLFLEILLTNAVEHGGSDVTIRIGATSSGFFVADDGPGIGVSPPDRVFEAGYASEDQNSGFGLYIASRIAKEHGWLLSVTESEDRGARFTVTGVERPD